MIESDATLRTALREASASFRKRGDRHNLATPDVIYCAFSTPRFTVTRAEAQRDAARRLQRFGVGRAQIEGRRVLDLGCNNGAILFQLSNLAPSYGLGIEYDSDKVGLARRIASFAGLPDLEFRVGDLDQLEAKDIGEPFDAVFCLAIEAHVQKPRHLYELLADVTRERLYFEANASTSAREVERELARVGFRDVRHLGVCDDDIRPRNNKRPIFTASRV